MQKIVIKRPSKIMGMFDRLDAGNFVHSLECMVLDIKVKGIWFHIEDRFIDLLPNEKN